MRGRRARAGPDPRAVLSPMAWPPVVESRVYPDVDAPAVVVDKADVDSQAPVPVGFQEEPPPAMASEPRVFMASEATGGGGDGASEPRGDPEDPPVYSDRPLCFCGPSEAYLAARPRLKNLVRARCWRRSQRVGARGLRARSPAGMPVSRSPGCACTPFATQCRRSERAAPRCAECCCAAPPCSMCCAPPRPARASMFMRARSARR